MIAFEFATTDDGSRYLGTHNKLVILRILSLCRIAAKDGGLHMSKVREFEVRSGVRVRAGWMLTASSWSRTTRLAASVSQFLMTSLPHRPGQDILGQAI